MDKLTCQEIQNLLVDYADDMLDKDSVAKVNSHLTGCPACRNTLQNLPKSLLLTQAIWHDNLNSVLDKSVLPDSKSILSKWLKPIAVAAGLLLVTGLYLSFTIPDSGAQELAFEQIERQIEQNATAARLLAAAEMLAELPNTGPIAKKQYTYILQTYPESSAAAQARSRINEL